MSVDWSKPIEAFRESDGKVVSMTLSATAQPDKFGNYITETAPDPSDSNEAWNDDGTDRCWHQAWIIRNTQPATTQIDTELWERVIDLTRRMADSEMLPNTGLGIDAREIVKLLPVEVDPDLVEARSLAECTVHWSPQTDRDLASGKNDATAEVKIALAAIKRGRELERANA